jgi:hypothetical protein
MVMSVSLWEMGCLGFVFSEKVFQPKRYAIKHARHIFTRLLKAVNTLSE